MEFCEDTPARNLNTGRNGVFGHGHREGEFSPGSLSSSSASGSNQCEQEHGNSPGLTLPLQQVIRRRLTVKQRRPPAYPKDSGKMKGVKTAAEYKGFAIAKPMTKQEKKQLHNRSQGLLMQALVKEVGKDKIRACQKWGKLRDRARVWWSRLNPDEKREMMLKASKSVKRGGQDEKAINFVADGMDVDGSRYRRCQNRSAAERANRNCRYKSKAVLVTYQSRKLVLAILDEWRGLSDSLLVERLKEDGDILRLIDIASKDVDDMQTRIAAIEWSASLELCVETFNTEHECRLHVHFVGFRPEGFRYTDGTRTSHLRLHRLDIKPSHIKGCIDPTSGRRCKTTAALHYYCQMPKKGLIASWTNHVAFKDFLVSPRWIVSFVQRGKMTHEDAKKVTVFSFLRGARRHTHIPKITLFHRYPFLTYFGHVLFTKCTPCLGSTTICREKGAKQRGGRQTPKRYTFPLFPPESSKKHAKGSHRETLCCHFFVVFPKEKGGRN